MSDSNTMRYRPHRGSPASPTAAEEAWLDARSAAEIEAAAAADPDNPPLRAKQLAGARRNRLPVGTVRDWEQGRSIPDAPARAIDSGPEVLARVLTR